MAGAYTRHHDLVIYQDIRNYQPTDVKNSLRNLVIGIDQPDDTATEHIPGNCTVE